MASIIPSIDNAKSGGEEWIPNRKNVGIPDHPFRYQFPHHIGPSIVFGSYLKSRPVLAPVDQMFRQLYCQNLPNPTSLYLLLRILKRIKIVSWEIRQHLDLHSASVEKLHRRPRSAQLWDLIRLQLFTEESSEDYYEGQLARHHGDHNLFAYLPYLEFVWVTINLQRDLFGIPAFFLNHKVSFSQWARANGVATPPEVVVSADPFPLPELESELIALGEEIIVKPSNLLMGKGVEAWARLPHGSWQRNQQVLDPPQFVARLQHLIRQYQCSIVVQKRLKNHPDLIPICGDVLATNRVVTIINENGSPEVVELRWRMATTSGSVADNFTQGGIYWSVDDFKTGHINLGDRSGLETSSGRMDHHPIHGRKMVGSFHPFAPTIINFALEGHRKMPNVLMVGWDIAMSPTGPIALEVNFPPAATARFQMTWNGFENARYGQILGHHARRWLATMAPTPPTI